MAEPSMRERVAQRIWKEFDARRYADAILPLIEEAVTAERERCAAVAVDMARDPHWNTGASNVAHLIAAAIRADREPVKGDAKLSGNSADRVEAACKVMHDAYEQAAVAEGWETQERSRKPWADVPEANKATMRAAVGALLDWLRAAREPEPATEAKMKDEAMVVCRIISAVDNNEYRGAKQLLASDWLRERDAEKWDEGHAYGFYDQSENTKHSNPYREPEPAIEAPRLVREPECVKNWPGCENGEYNPACCRWPKSCSVQLVPAPATEVGPVEKCRECGREEWGHSWLDHVK